MRNIMSTVAAVVVVLTTGDAVAFECTSTEVIKNFGGTPWVILGCSSGYDMVMRDASVDSGSAARIRVTIYASERRFEVMSFGGKNEKARRKAEEAVRNTSFGDMQALMNEVSD